MATKKNEIEEVKLWDWKMKLCVVIPIVMICLCVAYVWDEGRDGKIIVIQDQYLGYEDGSSLSPFNYIELEQYYDGTVYQPNDGMLRVSNEFNLDLLEPGATYSFTLENMTRRGVIFGNYRGNYYNIIDVEFVSPSPWRS